MGKAKIRTPEANSALIDAIEKASKIAIEGHESKKLGFAKWRDASFTAFEKKFNAKVQGWLSKVKGSQKIDDLVDRLRSELAVVNNIAIYLQEEKNKLTPKDFNKYVNWLEKKHNECVNKARGFLENGKKIREDNIKFLNQIIQNSAPVFALAEATATIKTKEIAQTPKQVDSWEVMNQLSLQPGKLPHKKRGITALEAQVQILKNKVDEAKEQQKAKVEGKSTTNEEVTPTMPAQTDEGLQSLKNNTEIKEICEKIKEKKKELKKDMNGDVLAQYKYTALKNIRKGMKEAKCTKQFIEAVNICKESKEIMDELDKPRKPWSQFLQKYTMFGKADTGDLVRKLDEAVQEEAAYKLNQ